MIPTFDILLIIALAGAWLTAVIRGNSDALGWAIILTFFTMSVSWLN